jgi:hypothetical protein
MVLIGVLLALKHLDIIQFTLGNKCELSTYSFGINIITAMHVRA